MSIFRTRLIDESTESVFAYLFDHVWWGVITVCSFPYWLAFVAPVSYYLRSSLLLIICMILASLLGIIVSVRSRRTFLGALCDVVTAIGLYLYFQYGKYLPKTLSVLTVITLLFSIFGVLFIGCRRVKNIEHLKEIMYVRFVRSLLLVRRNFGIAALIVSIILPIGMHFFVYEKMCDDFYEKYVEENEDNSEGEKSNVLTVSAAYGDEYRLSDNIDTIKLIRDNETFQTLDYDKKCEVIRAVILCEARYLGLCEIEITFEELEDSDVLGFYSHYNKRITINSTPVKDGSAHGGSAQEILITCLHESRHCYQYLLSEMYKEATPLQRNLLVFTQEGVRDWIINMSDYKNETESEEGYVEYLTQILEQDARDYATKEAIVYFKTIDKVLAEKE